jgi:hypothetical protein
VVIKCVVALVALLRAPSFDEVRRICIDEHSAGSVQVEFFQPAEKSAITWREPRSLKLKSKGSEQPEGCGEGVVM